MNEREAQELLDFLVQHDVTDLELEQTGGGVYAVIRKDADGVSVYVPLDESIEVHFYQGTAWEDGDRAIHLWILRD
jgi:hypothetical protein